MLCALLRQGKLRYWELCAAMSKSLKWEDGEGSRVMTYFITVVPPGERGQSRQQGDLTVSDFTAALSTELLSLRSYGI